MAGRGKQWWRLGCCVWVKHNSAEPHVSLILVGVGSETSVLSCWTCGALATQTEMKLPRILQRSFEPDMSE